MNVYTFRTVIEPEEPRGYHGFVPILPGVHTHGETLKDTQQHLKEAIQCHIQGLRKDKFVIPKQDEVIEMTQSFTEKELLTA